MRECLPQACRCRWRGEPLTHSGISSLPGGSRWPGSADGPARDGAESLGLPFICRLRYIIMHDARCEEHDSEAVNDGDDWSPIYRRDARRV